MKVIIDSDFKFSAPQFQLLGINFLVSLLKTFLRSKGPSRISNRSVTVFRGFRLKMRFDGEGGGSKIQKNRK